MKYRIINKETQFNFMKVLLGKDAERMLTGMPVAKSFLIKKENELVKIKKFPVVMKIISSKAVHKTDISGVNVVNNQKEAQDTFTKFTKLAKLKKIKLTGILVQEYVKGREFIIGIKNDSTFGHVIMFGAGGIFVESLKDVAFRVCPINEKDAESMLSDLKNQWLISGVRGQKPINSNIIKQLLVRISKIPQRRRNIEELDINPLIADEKGAKIVDVRIVVR